MVPKGGIVLCGVLTILSHLAVIGHSTRAYGYRNSQTRPQARPIVRSQTPRDPDLNGEM